MLGTPDSRKEVPQGKRRAVQVSASFTAKIKVEGRRAGDPNYVDFLQLSYQATITEQFAITEVAGRFIYILICIYFCCSFPSAYSKQVARVYAFLVLWNFAGPHR